MSKTIIVMPTTGESVTSFEQKQKQDNVKYFFVLLCVCCCLPVMFIVAGARTKDVVCVSPCKNYGCTSKDEPYVLPTPQVGISVSTWLIMSGISYVLFVLSMMFLKKASPIVYLFIFSWLIVGAVVHAETVNLCDTHDNGLWSIQSDNIKWLLASVVSGMVIFIFIPLIICTCGATCGEKRQRRSWGFEV